MLMVFQVIGFVASVAILGVVAAGVFTWLGDREEADVLHRRLAELAREVADRR